MRSPVPAAVARSYLDQRSGRIGLIGANAVGVMVGLNFYLEQLTETSLFAWPVVIDSPLALLWMTASLLTLLPLATTADYPDGFAFEVLNTLAVASLVKYALWTALVLNLFFGQYFPEPWSYFGILFTHLVMLFEAFLVPYYARTSAPAIGVTAAWLLANDAADYLLGYHPRVRAADLDGLPYASVALTVLAVALAAYVLDRADDPPG